MNSMLEMIKTRRSVRAYLDRPVPGEIIEEIIDCARYAPTALNRQPWHFTVVTDRGLIRELAEGAKKKIRLLLKFRFILWHLYPDLRDKKFLARAREKAFSEKDRIFYEAPVLIFISTPENSTHGLKDSFLASQNIMLASYSLGLGTCVIGFAEAINKSKGLLKKLKLPPQHKVQAVITLGYPAIVPEHLPDRRQDNLTIIG
jgi:nitroreductase